MQLYYHSMSGHSHRAVLFLSLIGVPADLHEVDPAHGEHKAPAFLKLNRFGQIPVLVDAETVIADSNAILVYLAKKYRKTDWLPESPSAAASVQRWLSIAAGPIAYGPAAARLVTVFGAKFDIAEVIARAHTVLMVIDSELEGRDWIAASHPTIADVALYSYIARSPEGNVDLSEYGNVGTWLQRIESLPGFVPFRKTVAGLQTQV